MCHDLKRIELMMHNQYLIIKNEDLLHSYKGSNVMWIKRRALKEWRKMRKRAKKKKRIRSTLVKPLYDCYAHNAFANVFLLIESILSFFLLMHHLSYIYIIFHLIFYDLKKKTIFKRNSFFFKLFKEIQNFKFLQLFFFFDIFETFFFWRKNSINILWFIINEFEMK